MTQGDLEQHFTEINTCREVKVYFKNEKLWIFPVFQNELLPTLINESQETFCSRKGLEDGGFPFFPVQHISVPIFQATLVRCNEKPLMLSVLRKAVKRSYRPACGDWKHLLRKVAIQFLSGTKRCLLNSQILDDCGSPVMQSGQQEQFTTLAMVTAYTVQPIEDCLDYDCFRLVTQLEFI